MLNKYFRFFIIYIINLSDNDIFLKDTLEQSIQIMYFHRTQLRIEIFKLELFGIKLKCTIMFHMVKILQK